MSGPIEFVKAHPVGVAVGAVTIIGGALLVFGGSGSGGASEIEPMTGYPSLDAGGGSSVEAGVELARISATAAVRQQEIEAQREIALDENATAFSIANLSKMFAENELFAKTEIAGKELDLAEYRSTLEAQSESERIAAEVAVNEAREASLRAQQQLTLDVVKENNKPKGLFSWLFG